MSTSGKCAGCALVPLATARGSVTKMKREFNDDHTPLGYLITFRAYGTWLHGDAHGAVDRHHHMFGSPMLAASPRRKQIEKGLLKQPPVKFGRRERAAIDFGVRETCAI